MTVRGASTTHRRPRACRIVAAAAILIGALAATPSAAQAPAATPSVVEASIEQLQAAMDRGEVTAVDLVDAYVARIAAYDQSGPALNAILLVNPNARQRAAELDDERRASGPRGPLHGIPIILKDNYDTADMPTTGSSLALAGFTPDRDGFQVRRLREAGAVIVAKSNLHELAMGITTISSLGGQTRNPYDLTRNPGGSSGGTGAAVAASFAAVGMGSDTCGSIRIPSSQNNLVGLRPTKGISSISGIIPLSHTQDTGGPLARTTADLAIVLDATVGADPDDPATALVAEVDVPRFRDALDATALDGARFGKLGALFESPAAESSVLRVIDDAVADLEQQGATVIEAEVPGLRDLMSKSGVIAFEFKFDFIDYLAAQSRAPIGSLDDVLRAGLHHEALRSRFELRNQVEERDSDEYRAALRWRTVLRDAVVQTLEEHRLDGLLYPTLVHRPEKIGEAQTGSNCALSANSGLPAISVAAGFTDDQLPVGLEILGAPLDDARLVGFAYAFEQGTDHRRAPAVTPPLINGAAPPPVVFSVQAQSADAATTTTVVFSLDRIRNRLDWTLDADSSQGILAATLHREESGPAVARLRGRRGDPQGTLTLTPALRRWLEAGELWVRLFTHERPADPALGRLLPPARLP